MAVDQISEAETDITEQARWGLSRGDRAVVRIVAAAKLIAFRLKALEDRVSALEGKPR